MNEKKIKLKNKYLQQTLMLLLVGVILIIAYYVVNHMPVIKEGFAKLNDILMPFYIGIVMAYLLCPIYNATVRLVYKLNKGRFKKPARDFKFARFFGTLSALALLIVVVAGLMMLVIPDLWDSIMGLAMGAPEIAARAQDWISANVDQNPEFATLLQGKLENMSDTIILWAQDRVLPGAEAILTGVVGTLGTVLDIFVALIICVYILNSKELFAAQTRKLILATFKQERAEKFFELGRLSNQTFGGFINGKIIDSAIIGILCFVVLTIFEIPMTMLISVVVGVTNIIPFFGPFIGAIPSIIILLIVEPIAALKFGIIILIIQQLDGNIIGPKILGKTTKLASFWVMFAIIVGGGLFGFPGMILGVPVFAILYTYLSRGVNAKLESKMLDTCTIAYEDFSKYNVDKEEIFCEDRINKDGDSRRGEKLRKMFDPPNTGEHKSGTGRTDGAKDGSAGDSGAGCGEDAGIE